MNETSFRINFNERRAFSSFKKTIHYVGGALLIVIGLSGLIMLNNEMSTFYWILIVGGIFNVGIGFMGKYLHREHNFIVIKSDIIEFKNSSQNQKSFLINDLLDIVIDSNKAEFITHDHQVCTYNFSVFANAEKENLHGELDKLKTSLISV